MSRHAWGRLTACLLTLLILGPVGWLWWTSRTPSSYSVLSMGYADFGGGPHDGMASGPMRMTSGGTSVTSLVPPAGRRADVTFDLVARHQRVTLASGRTVDGYTVNGTSPGPQLTVHVGQLVEVHVHNASVTQGLTIHWHGLDVPNGEDGVAGVTQDAIRVGGEFTYRFVADHVGTYWYHSHVDAEHEVGGGLFGALVVLPARPTDDATSLTVLAHTYAGTPTLNGRTAPLRVTAGAGQTVRARIVDTDDDPLEVWSAAPYRLVAVDGYDVNRPTPVTGKVVDVPAGGRADVEVTVPADGSAVLLQLSGGRSVLVGPAGATARPVSEPSQATLDLLHYGSPAALPFDPAHADRHFTYDIGRRPGFLGGRPGLWWTVGGHFMPHMPMFVVAEGDVVVVHVHNGSGQIHPIHLHGHHAVVLDRDGVRATGSPWWFDSLDVLDGQSYDIAFVADNPGIWMDHCHNLAHASQGLMTHLTYAGVTTPYRIGGENRPE